jgi:hypothetical protein
MKLIKLTQSDFNEYVYINPDKIEYMGGRENHTFIGLSNTGFRVVETIEDIIKAITSQGYNRGMVIEVTN